MTWFTYDIFKGSVWWLESTDAAARCKHMFKNFWTADTVEMYIKEGQQQWEEHPPAVREVIKAILLFFAASDAFANTLALENILGAYPEDMHIRGMISIHGMFEIIHAETYALLLQIPYPQGIDKKTVYDAIHDSPPVLKMLEWGHQFTKPDVPHIDRLVGMVSYEGGIFTGLFAAIYAIKSQNVQKAITSANEYIARDELDHVNNVLVLLRYEVYVRGAVLDEAFVHRVFAGAMECCIALIDFVLPVDIPSWNLVRADLIGYTQTVINKILEALDMRPLYKTDFELPEHLVKKDLPQITSFHSLRPTQYTRAESSTAAEIDATFDAGLVELVARGLD